ncbi:MAG: hypothetical protein AAFT19_08560 [Pseudomonadota bacterium]
MRYEYKVIASPERGSERHGAKSGADRLAAALEEIFAEQAAAGWAFQRAEVLPVLEGGGTFTRPDTVEHAVLIFRRPVGTASDVTSPAAIRPSAPPPQEAPVEARPTAHPAAERETAVVRQPSVARRAAPAETAGRREPQPPAMPTEPSINALPDTAQARRGQEAPVDRFPPHDPIEPRSLDREWPAQSEPVQPYYPAEEPQMPPPKRATGAYVNDRAGHTGSANSYARDRTNAPQGHGDHGMAPPIDRGAAPNGQAAPARRQPPDAEHGRRDERDLGDIREALRRLDR